MSVSPCKIIDFHTHCYPEFLAARAMSKVDGTEFKPVYDGTYRGLMEDNERSGIDKAVVLCIANRPAHEKNVNDFALEVNAQGGLIAFGSVHPFSSDYKYFVDMLFERGIKGMKFQPFYQEYEVNDRRAMAVYEYIAEKGMVLLLHSGVDLIVKGHFCTPKKVREVLDCLKYPKTVLAHMGGWGYGEELFKEIVGQSCYLDTSFSLRYEDDATKKRFVDSHGADRILFGTDRPWVDAKTDIEVVKALGEDIAQKILYKNAADLLGL